MSDIKKDLEDIEVYLSQPSPLGLFARKDMPEYQVLKAEVENSGRILAKAEHVCNMRRIEHMLCSAKLQAFLNGEELPKDRLEEIETSIANFTTEFFEGKWS